MKTVVENDETKFLARAAVIVAAIRSGGTFLAHCLSNHPDVFCDRGESLHHTSLWHTHLTADRRKLLYCLTHMQGYQVSVCKLTYQQAFSEVWKYVRGLPILWLRRRDTIRQAVSVILNEWARAGKIERPQHTFGRVAPVRVNMGPGLVLRAARGLVEQDRKAEERLAGLDVLPLFYEEIIGPASTLMDGEAARICTFLGVRRWRMWCDLTRINAEPLEELIINWDEVRGAIEGSEFAECLNHG